MSGKDYILEAIGIAEKSGASALFDVFPICVSPFLGVLRQRAFAADPTPTV